MGVEQDIIPSRNRAPGAYRAPQEENGGTPPQKRIPRENVAHAPYIIFQWGAFMARKSWSKPKQGQKKQIGKR